MLLWFDVGIIEITTRRIKNAKYHELWFDVGIIEITTLRDRRRRHDRLWFDVGIIENTTYCLLRCFRPSCGLM